MLYVVGDDIESREDDDSSRRKEHVVEEQVVPTGRVSGPAPEPRASIVTGTTRVDAILSRRQRDLLRQISVSGKLSWL